MADFEKSIEVILKHEGGFVNHPSDPGGATNKGITFALFKRYAKALSILPTVDSLKNLTIDQAKFIYREEFWDKMQGDQINDQQLATLILDGFVNMGFRALKIAQTEAGAKPDGAFGPQTIQMINSANSKVLFNGIKDSRIIYYKHLAKIKPKMIVFLNGWLNRINSFSYL